MMDLAPNVVVADRFRLVRQLGQGGMGSVWLAHHVKLDVPCAVKFINAEVAETMGVRGRFEREAKAAAQIRSPHVVQVLDCGVCEGVPYIGMELLEGEDLAHRLAKRGRITPEETVQIVAQIARALTKAHALALVHRDLKPENVFLVRDEEGEIVKVLDFGIAKAPLGGADAATSTGALLGTPRFMSPEQAQGMKTLDHRSDLWSLGVIAYRCIVGQFPFESEALGDLLMRIIVHPIPIPSQALPGLPAAFDGWWAKAAARDPAQRFQSAKELADTLAQAFGIAVSPSAAIPTGSSPAIGGPGVPPTVAGQTPPPLYPTPGQFSQPSYPAVGAQAYPSGQTTPQPVSPSAQQYYPTPAPYTTPLQPGAPGPSGYTPAGTTPWNGPPANIAIGATQLAQDRTMEPASRTYPSAPEAQKSKSGSSRVVIILSAIIAVLVIGGVALFGFRGKKTESAAADSTATIPLPSASASVAAAPTVTLVPETPTTTASMPPTSTTKAPPPTQTKRPPISVTPPRTKKVVITQ